MTIDSQLSSLINAKLNEKSPTPLYFQLYNIIKREILNGSIENGSQLPTEAALSAQFSISRITAKRAMDELAVEGLVARKRAKGTHVTHSYAPKPVKAPLTGMLEEIEFLGTHSDAKVIEVTNARPSAALAAEFKLESNETLLRVTRVRSRNKEAFGYYTSWTKGLTKQNTKADFEVNTRLELLRLNNIEIKHVTQIINAIGAMPDVAYELGVSDGFPLLNLMRRSFDEDENLVDYLHVRYHPDRFQYQMDLTPDINT
jgi:GntR family transcriptional regulator